MRRFDSPFWLSSMANSNKYTIKSTGNNSLYYQWENFANYLNTFGKHTVGAMVGMSFTKNHWDNNTISSTGTNILSDYAPNFQYIDYLLADERRNTIGRFPQFATCGTPYLSHAVFYYA